MFRISLWAILNIVLRSGCHTLPMGGRERRRALLRKVILKITPRTPSSAYILRMIPDSDPLEPPCANQLPALVIPTAEVAFTTPLPDGNLIPSIIANSGEQAAWRYVDFFTSNIRI
jgi:hypothetical protein